MRKESTFFFQEGVCVLMKEFATIFFTVKPMILATKSRKNGDRFFY